ncbi:hypothetical protein Rhe02_67740 [Rhizocola hellebori]|uniref:Uncharacterized protein n=1 Tax=Rhizocola hellebori TaxID=1392758 RepID=A0A8J3QFL4_9ACTN|nr:hypothetical protein [Rhizocola hellebori]GIH08707.1 hypothetical protein Rhe02_67740 [Rhizocola hellebori]
MNRSKLRGIVAGLSIAIVVGVTGIALAAFTQQATVEKVMGGTDTFKQLTLTGVAGDTTLFPNQKTSVTLTIDNKANDVAIAVTEISPMLLADEDITGVTDVAYCKSMLKLTGTKTIYPVDPNASLKVVVANAIELSTDADNRCQGMKFGTKWTVTAKTAA